jgi:4-amino-4-deoxy-L-arabinose transferase-like glycosyltransferase
MQKADFSETNPEARAATSTDRLTPKDFGLLVLLALLLFGYETISGKPLTMHEARLPQCSREMLASGEWLLPRSGERPWLERPPFPHWVELIAGHIFGGLEKVWVVRIPPALMGLLTLLAVAWTAARLFGRKIAMLSAVALATMYEFYFYAGQAEDDIFLAFLAAVCVAAFVATEFPVGGNAPDARRHFFGNRRWTVWLFFTVLGMTSLAKGPLVGAIELVAATGMFLLVSWREGRITRYLWLWGWILFAVLTAGWSVYAGSVYPSLWANYKYDYTGPFGHEPVWYYFAAILWTTAPWTPLWLLGIFLVWPRKGEKLTPEKRFLLCWALLPLLAISIPSRKHHHYLVPILPAFAVLAAFGAQRVGEMIRDAAPKKIVGTLPGLLLGIAGFAAFAVLAFLQKIPGPLWASLGVGATFLLCLTGIGFALGKKDARMVLVTLCAGMVVFCAWGQSVLGRLDEYKNGDIAFIERVRRIVPADKPLMIEAFGSLDFFRFQFYSRPDAVLLHNVTYLRDERIKADQVYVIARAYRRPFLLQLGDCQTIDASSRARREISPEKRFTLYLLTFKPGLQRYPAPKVSVLQALDRGVYEQEGPYCGPPTTDDEVLRIGN